ncbi:MAG: tyrosine--tRNA ligase [Collinsella sp.]
MKILDPEKTTIVHNGDWMFPMGLKELLSIASKFTVARILERDDFTKRYQSQTPIALHEFLYPVMQAYDSVKIEADVEMGGTDQLFNLLAGRELMEKMGMEPQIALTMPLLEGTDGTRKMSKSYGNYIGLTDEPADMFGKTMSIPDEMIAKYYRLASSKTPDEVDAIEASLADGTGDPYSSSAPWPATSSPRTTPPRTPRPPRPSSTASSARISCPRTSPRFPLDLHPGRGRHVYLPGFAEGLPAWLRLPARPVVSSTAAASRLDGEAVAPQELQHRRRAAQERHRAAGRQAQSSPAWPKLRPV